MIDRAALPGDGSGRFHHARFARGRNYGWAESACPELPASRVAGPARIQSYPARPYWFSGAHVDPDAASLRCEPISMVEGLL